MNARLLNLEARRHDSRVLGEWLAGRAGAEERLGRAPTIQAAGENSVTTNLTASQLAEVLGLSATTYAGVPVTAETAMRVTTVYACIALLAGAIASLPLGVFEREKNARKKADHEYWWLFNEQANEDMTSAVAWEYLYSSKFLYGDGFAELLRPSRVSTRVIGWKPHHPLRVDPFRDDRGVLLYRIQPTRGEAYVLDSADMIHLPSLGFDGLRSPSPITYAAREAVGTAIAGESFNARFFSEGATFDFALKTTGSAKLDKDQLDVLKTSLLSRLHGAGHKRSPLILSGLEPAQLTINPKDAEILATRLFTVEELCRVLGVPPFMVGHTDKQTSWGTGMEALGAGFVRYTLQRHLTPLAQELNRKLWPTRARYFVEHITAALERGDLKSRFEAYRIALGRAGEQAWMDVDEVRRLENMAPMESVPGPMNTEEGEANAQPTA